MRQRERIAEAKRRGKRAGLAAASWVFDGNTKQSTRDAVAEAIREGDDLAGFGIEEPGWLSGEWAGESPAELLDGLLKPASDDETDGNFEVMEAYETAASEAWHREVERTANLNLG